MGGLDGPPKPPALGIAPAKPWRSSILLGGRWGLDGAPKPPALGIAPAKPWRSSILLEVAGASTGPPSPPRSEAPRQSRGAPRSCLRSPGPRRAPQAPALLDVLEVPGGRGGPTLRWLAALHFEGEVRVDQRGAAVGVDQLAGEPARVRRAEKCDDVSNVGWCPHPTHRRPAARVPGSRGIDGGLREAVQHAVVRETGTHRVDRNPVRGQGYREVPHE